MNKIFIPQLKYGLENIEYCKLCRGRYIYWCTKSNHEKETRLNTPFIIPDLKVKHMSGKWIRLVSEKMNKQFEMSSSKFQPIVLGCGIQPGGLIPDQWWITTTVGGSLTLKWLGSKNGEYLPQE